MMALFLIYRKSEEFKSLIATLNTITKGKIKFLNKFATWLLKKVEKNRAKIEKYGILGVALFVAIPLPGTGAWTGSLVAAVIDMKFRKSVLSAFIGVLIAGIVITLVCYGGVDAVIKLFA